MDLILQYYQMALEYIYPMLIYVNTHENIFLGIASLLTIYLTISLFIPKKKLEVTTEPSSTTIVITSKDISAIAGEDVMATQLDLARAYIELDRKKLAKQILEHVIKNGDKVQQGQARQIMNDL